MDDYAVFLIVVAENTGTYTVPLLPHRLGWLGVKKKLLYFLQAPISLIQTHERFKRTLLIKTKHYMRIFLVYPVYEATKLLLNNS